MLPLLSLKSSRGMLRWSYFAHLDSLCYNILLKGNKRVKLYTDEEGNPKGDAKCTYLRVESVDLAMTILHESEIRPGYRVNIQRVR